MIFRFNDEDYEVVPISINIEVQELEDVIGMLGTVKRHFYLKPNEKLFVTFNKDLEAIDVILTKKRVLDET